MLRENLKVALLLHSLVDAKNITHLFKEEGVLPCYFENAQTLLQAIHNESFDLIVLDIRLCSSGDIFIPHHQKIAQHQISLALFATPETKPLLDSSTDILEIGILGLSGSLKRDVHSLLKRVEWKHFQEKETKRLSRVLHQTEVRLRDEVMQLEKRKESQRYERYLQNMLNYLENLASRDLASAVSELFNNTKEIKEFAILTLDKSKEKIINAATPFTDKLQTIPALYIGNKVTEGIPEFAQNAIGTILLDTLGDTLITLNIKGLSKHPDFIIAIVAENDFIQFFPWNQLEKELSMLHLKFLAGGRPQTLLVEKRLLQPFEMLTALDHSFDVNQKRVLNYELIDIDFSKLFEAIDLSAQKAFAYSHFFRDFVAGIEFKSKIDFKLANMGPCHIALVVPSAFLDQFFTDLQKFSTRFPYYKYFDESETLFARDLTPKIKMVPFSSAAYLRFLKDGAVHYVRAKVESPSKVTPPTQNLTSLNIRRPELTTTL